MSWIKPNGQSVAEKVLEFMKINRSKAGEYTCEASNECGNSTEMASIDVQCKHFIFKSHYHIALDPVEKSILQNLMAVLNFCFFIVKPENVELAISAKNNKSCLGDVVNFTCSAHANPAVSLYQLFENDTALLDTNAVGMWNKTFTSGGAYFYKCVANNTMGSINGKDVRLTVKGNFFEFCQSIFWFSAFCISRCFGKVHVYRIGNSPYSLCRNNTHQVNFVLHICVQIPKSIWFVCVRVFVHHFLLLR